MNKKELIDALAEKLIVSKVDAAEVLEIVVGTIIEGALKGEAVIPGLGKLKLTDVKASSGVGMGKAWSKPAHKKLKLVLSKEGKTLGN